MWWQVEKRVEKWAVRVKRPRQKHMVSTREGDVGRGSLEAASTTDTPHQTQRRR
jgi:hypothetical protein